MTGPVICGQCGQTHDPRKCPRHVDEAQFDGSVVLRPCRAWPIRGGTVCKDHGGSAPQVRAAAARRLEAERVTAELSKLGVSLPLADGEGLQAMRNEAAGNVLVLRRMVQRLGLDPDGQGPHVYESTFHHSGRPTGEAKAHVVWVMYCDERERLAKLDEACVRLGLSERRVRVEEAEVLVFAGVIDGVLSRFVPAERHGECRRWLAGEFRLLDGSRPALPAGSEVA